MKTEGGRKRRALHAVFTAACLLACGTADLHAQGAADTGGYPNRPIRVVVPFTPGDSPTSLRACSLPSSPKSSSSKSWWTTVPARAV